MSYLDTNIQNFPAVAKMIKQLNFFTLQGQSININQIKGVSYEKNSNSQERRGMMNRSPMPDPEMVPNYNQSSQLQIPNSKQLPSNSDKFSILQNEQQKSNFLVVDQKDKENQQNSADQEQIISEKQKGATNKYATNNPNILRYRQPIVMKNNNLNQNTNTKQEFQNTIQNQYHFVISGNNNIVSKSPPPEIEKLELKNQIKTQTRQLSREIKQRPLTNYPVNFTENTVIGNSVEADFNNKSHEIQQGIQNLGRNKITGMAKQENSSKFIELGIKNTMQVDPNGKPLLPPSNNYNSIPLKVHQSDRISMGLEKESIQQNSPKNQEYSQNSQLLSSDSELVSKSQRTTNVAKKEAQFPLTSVTQSEIQKVDRYFRYRLITMISLICKKEKFNDECTKPGLLVEKLASLTLQKQPKINSNFDSALKQLVKCMNTKGQYQYRERFLFANVPLINTAFYDVQKRLAQLQAAKSGVKSSKQKNENESSSGSEDQQEDISPQKSNKLQMLSANDFASWKQKNQIEPQTKVFIVKGGYSDLKQSLIDRGWVENTDYFSPFFDLKWTCQMTDIDYPNLDDHQYVNHFDNNVCCTSKYGLSKSLRTLNSYMNLDSDLFYPRCFDLGDLADFQDFVENFKFTKALSDLIEIEQKLDFLQNPNDQFLQLQIRLSINICNRYFITLASKLHLIVNNDLFPIIPMQEYEIINSSESDLKLIGEQKLQSLLQSLRVLQETDLKLNSTSENKFEMFRELIKKCLHQVQEKDPQFNLYGHKNIWIVQPNCKYPRKIEEKLYKIQNFFNSSQGSSRARGIKCFNTFQKIMDYIVGKEVQFVAQKYLENPLIIRKQKFDIRQWVIVQDFNPPRIWFYSECYLRFCSKEYNPEDISNRFAHLTNNSVNQYVGSEDQAIGQHMWSQSAFVQHLKTTYGRDIFYQEIQPQFKKIVISSIISCADQIGGRKNSMELFGYDFIIDDQFNPWLIEINSSPTMEYSTEITTELVQEVMEDTVQVMVDYSMSQKNNQQNIDTGKFSLIYQGEPKQQNSSQTQQSGSTK